MNSRKIKICWLTATYFLDVDIPVVPKLQEAFDVDWIILSTPSNAEEDKKMIEATRTKNFEIKLCGSNLFSLKTFLFYFRVIKQIAKKNYDMIYLDLSGMPYFHILAKWYLPVDKCVIAAHNVTTPKGARYYHLAKPYMEFIVRSFNKFQVFSSNQLKVLKSMKMNSEVLYAPLCLKDYGKPTREKPENPVNFLFFGNIVEYKRVDILLNAVKLLKAKGITNFKVRVCGYCPLKKWEAQYKPLIEDNGIVECDIRRIPNNLIPNLFEESHYFVMPYQDIAQSGAMTVAFCYNLPVIASELDTFKEFLIDQEDGYFFEPGNEEDLAQRMEFVIKNHHVIYNKLRAKQRQMVDEKLSNNTIIEKYKIYIDQICQN